MGSFGWYDLQKDTLYIGFADEPWQDDLNATEESVVVRIVEGHPIGLTIRDTRNFMGELLLPGEIE